MPQILNQKTVGRNGFPFNQFDEKIEYTMGMCPYAEEHLPKNVNLMFNPMMTEKDTEDIVKGIRKVAKYIL